MNTEAQLQLREQFYKETGMMWENSDDEPDIDYVEWLEAKVIAAQNDVSGALPSQEQIPILKKIAEEYIYDSGIRTVQMEISYAGIKAIIEEWERMKLARQ